MAKHSVAIQPALPDHADSLTALALASKAYWGYSDDFMAACRDELRVTPEDIIDPRYMIRIARRHDETVGFYTLSQQSLTDWELHALFVTPSAIGTGAGGALLRHAISSLQATNAARLAIQSDPGAEAFYLANGAIKVGETASGSIPGRVLPQLEIVISPTQGIDH